MTTMAKGFASNIAHEKRQAKLLNHISDQQDIRLEELIKKI